MPVEIKSLQATTNKLMISGASDSPRLLNISVYGWNQEYIYIFFRGVYASLKVAHWSGQSSRRKPNSFANGGYHSSRWSCLHQVPPPPPHPHHNQFLCHCVYFAVVVAVVLLLLLLSLALFFLQKGCDADRCGWLAQNIYKGIQR